MIYVQMMPHDDGTHTARCTVDGVDYEARSVSGSVFALCRQMVEAGVPDDAWIVPDRMPGTIFGSAVLCVNTKTMIVAWAPHPRETVGPKMAALVASFAELRAEQRRRVAA